MTLFNHMSYFMAMFFDKICKIKCSIKINFIMLFEIAILFPNFFSFPFDLRINWSVVSNICRVRTLLCYNLLMSLVEVFERCQNRDNLKYGSLQHLILPYNWYKLLYVLIAISSFPKTLFDYLDSSQSAFTSLKLTIETLEQGVKYVES